MGRWRNWRRKPASRGEVWINAITLMVVVFLVTAYLQERRAERDMKDTNIHDGLCLLYSRFPPPAPPEFRAAWDEAFGRGKIDCPPRPPALITPTATPTGRPPRRSKPPQLPLFVTVTPTPLPAATVTVTRTMKPPAKPRATVTATPPCHGVKVNGGCVPTHRPMPLPSLPL